MMLITYFFICLAELAQFTTFYRTKNLLNIRNMDSSLEWQACRLGNLAYGVLLRYQMVFQIDPVSHSLRFQKSHNKLVGFYFGLFVIMIVQLAMLDVVVEVWILKTFHTPFFVVVLNFTSLGLAIGCFSLLLISLRYRNTWSQYLNCAVKLREIIFKMTKPIKLCKKSASKTSLIRTFAGKIIKQNF